MNESKISLSIIFKGEQLICVERAYEDTEYKYTKGERIQSRGLIWEILAVEKPHMSCFSPPKIARTNLKIKPIDHNQVLVENDIIEKV